MTVTYNENLAKQLVAIQNTHHYFGEMNFESSYASNTSDKLIMRAKQTMKYHNNSPRKYADEIKIYLDVSIPVTTKIHSNGTHKTLEAIRVGIRFFQGGIANSYWQHFYDVEYAVQHIEKISFQDIFFVKSKQFGFGHAIEWFDKGYLFFQMAYKGREEPIITPKFEKNYQFCDFFQKLEFSVFEKLNPYA